MTGVVSTYWLIAAATPVMIVGAFRAPDIGPATLFAAIAAYCTYTGIRAWRRGWRSRFILRIVVPAALFVLSWAVVGVAIWIA